MKLLRSHWFPVLLCLITFAVIAKDNFFATANAISKKSISYDAYSNQWQPPNINELPDKEREVIMYGKELIVNTSYYFGPKGTVATLTNGMNCQNCHLDAGTKDFSNCFSAVASTYPKYRDRSGRVESIEFRINECMQRSLNGKAIDSSSKEMQAMVAYLKWLGKEVPKDVRPDGAGTEDLSFLHTPADPEKGKLVYFNKCQSCHGTNGEGAYNFDSSGFIYPPLWGEKSYNVSAGLYRISRFASFVKSSMPFGASHGQPQLTDEDAWNVAAFVNSQPRPEVLFSYDWPDISKKPLDYPFPPYSDQFSAVQHKYGPFFPIMQAKQSVQKNAPDKSKAYPNVK
jgi:thiosulfate dehydrogenase